MQLLQCSASLSWGHGQCSPCNALPHCLGAVGNATPALHCPTAWGQWAVQLLQCTASLPGAVGSATPAMHSETPVMHCPTGSGQWNSCNALPHCLVAVGSATPAIHCLTACQIPNGGQTEPWVHVLLAACGLLSSRQAPLETRVDISEQEVL